MKSKLLFMMVMLTLVTMYSCDDNTDNLGSSLINSVDNLKISTDTFKVTTRTIKADSVLSRSSIGYLGRVKDPETGSYITGSFMTQFHTMENYTYPASDSIVSHDAKGQIIADSAEIRLFYTTYYGDTLNAMKMTAYELDKPVEEGKPYYSNFDPLEGGYITRTNGIKKNKAYTVSDMNISDSIRSLSTYTRNIRIPLNDEYTDRDNVKYNNYGTYLMRKFYSNKDNYKNSYNFIHNVCPGFYFKTYNSLGNMVYVYVSQLNIYFRYMEGDTTYVGTTSFAGTEEVLQTTKITNDETSMNRLAADNSCTYLKSPSGLYTELTLPVSEVFTNHQNDTLSTAKIILTRINNTNQSSYNLSVPQYLLLLPKDSLYTFFEKGKLIDNETSYMAQYSSTYNSYTFYNISNMVRNLQMIKENGLKSDPSWMTKHPNWDKVVAVPVNATYTSSSSSYYGTSSSTLTKIDNNMSLASTKLVRGNGDSDNIIMSVIYSKFSNTK